MTATALALEPELIEHEVDAAMQYLETELWLEGVGSRRLKLLELVVPSRPPGAACPGDCGRSRPDGKMMCEQCWRHVAPAQRHALFRVWHRRQPEHHNPVSCPAFQSGLGHRVGDEVEPVVWP